MITRIIGIIFIGIILLTLGCGGGGVTSVVPNQNTPLPTNPPTATPTPNFTPTPTPITAAGQVTDLFSGQAITNCQISVDGQTVQPDNLGHFNLPLATAENHWYEIQVTSPDTIAREFYSQDIDNLAIKTLDKEYNTTMLRAYHKLGMDRPAIYFNPDDFPIKFVLYKFTDEGREVDAKTWEFVEENANYYQKNCFPVEIEVIDQRPDTDPRFDKSLVLGSHSSYFGYAIEENGQPTISFVVCEKYIELTEYAGGGSVRYQDYTITNGAVVLAPYQAVKDYYSHLSEEQAIEYYRLVVPHETGHACGFPHPFEIMPESDWPEFLEYSIMNYPVCGKDSDTMTTTDLETFVFLNNRGGGNQAPDFNPIPQITSSEVREIFQH